jgi:GNAT superfamily N-acetyltransferase
MKTKAAIRVNWMQFTDRPAVLELGQRVMGSLALTATDLNQMIRGGAVGIVASVSDQWHPVGFLLSSRMRNYIALHGVVVHSHYRRMGVGTALLQHVKERLREDCPEIVAFVPERFLVCQKFLRQARFLASPKVFRDYFPDQDAFEFRFQAPPPF